MDEARLRELEKRMGATGALDYPEQKELIAALRAAWAEMDRYRTRYDEIVAEVLVLKHVREAAERAYGINGTKDFRVMKALRRALDACR